jgi:hypothetical protein
MRRSVAMILALLLVGCGSEPPTRPPAPGLTDTRSGGGDGRCFHGTDRYHSRRGGPTARFDCFRLRQRGRRLRGPHSNEVSADAHRKRAGAVVRGFPARTT